MSKIITAVFTAALLLTTAAHSSQKDAFSKFENVGSTGQLFVYYLNDARTGFGLEIGSKIDRYDELIAFGDITPKTKVTVLGQPGMKTSLLPLLDKKWVTVVGRVRRTGQGEGQTVTWEELTIVLHPDPKPAGLAKK